DEESAELKLIINEEYQVSDNEIITNENNFREGTSDSCNVLSQKKLEKSENLSTTEVEET
ncbi:6303_t:CDS:1, partial [Ambispora leptoticha]